MKIQSVETERLATSHLAKEGLARLLQTLTLGVSEIDEVGVVRQNLLCRVSALLTRRLEAVTLLGSESRSEPLTLIFGKEREGGCSYSFSIVRSILYASRRAYVCTKVFHIFFSF